MPNQALEIRPRTANSPSTERNNSTAQQPGTDVLNNTSVSSGMNRDDLRRDLRPKSSNGKFQNTNPNSPAREEVKASPNNRGIERDRPVDGYGRQTIDTSNRATGVERQAAPRNESSLNSANASPTSRVMQRDPDYFKPTQESLDQQAIRAANRTQISAKNDSLNPAIEQSATLEEIRKAAARQALSDFQKSPATNLDERTAGNTIDSILKRHPSIASNPELRDQVIKAYTEQYQTTFDRNFESMGYFQRAYYGFTRQWSENVTQIGNFVSRSVEAVKSLPGKAVELAQSAKEAVGAVVERGAELASSAYKAVTNVENWKSVGSTIATAVTTVSDPRNWVKAGEWVVSKGADLAVGTWNAVTNIENWKAVGSAIGSGITAVAQFQYDILTNPAKALETIKSAGKAVGGFLYDMGASTGVNDLVYGVYKAGEAAVRFTVIAPAQFASALATNGASLLTGKQSFDQFMSNMGQATSDSYGKAFQCLAESGKAVKGAVMLAGEITGVTDLAKAGYYLATGDFKMAAMHGAFAAMSAGSIAATIATGGAAVGTVAAVAMGRQTLMQGIKTVGKVALKEFAQEAVEKVGKEAGETIVKKMTAELGQQFEAKVVQCTKNVVEKGVNELAQQVEKQGREALVGKLALQNVENIMHKVGVPEVHNLLKELKVYDRVRAEAFDIAKNIDTSSVKEIAGQLEKLGMSSETSRTAAKQLKKAFKAGVSDDAIAEGIAKGITDEISNEIINYARTPFQDAMRSAFNGTLDTEAGKRLANAMEKHNIKLTEQEIDELVEASWRGYERAIKEATAEVVLKAVKDGIRDYRNASNGSRSNFHLPENELRSTLTASDVEAAATISPERAREAHRITVTTDHAGKRRVGLTRNNTLLDKTTEVDDIESIV